MSDPVQITDKIQWHPGFDGGIELALRKYKKELTYHREYQLSKKPLQIDVLIVKKRSDSVIDTPIGKIFSVHNIVEYKNPTDYVNIDDFYKTFGYACLYKALGKHVNDIPGDQLTVSIFRIRIRWNWLKN